MKAEGQGSVANGMKVQNYIQGELEVA